MTRFWLTLLLAVVLAPAHALETVRIGVMASGTVHWELELMAARGLAAREGVALELVRFANKDATHVALAGGAVDVIVDDWLWVSRSRDEGKRYTLVTHSLAAGALYARADSGIVRPEDLAGRRLGVAGGALDKSWLLLRAWGRRRLGVDLAQAAEPSFAAPPLLNALFERGELPAVLNYWHYGARLEARGLRPLLTVREVLAGLGAPPGLPLIGWVFDEDWAAANRAALGGFLRASRAAKTLLAGSDEAWDAVRPLTGAESEAVFRALREGYRAGIPAHVGPDDRLAAEAVFALLAGEGGAALVGRGTQLAPGTFWDGYRD